MNFGERCVASGASTFYDSKAPASPSMQSCTSSSSGEHGGQSLHSAPARLSVQDASLICRRVRAELLPADVVDVVVLSYNYGTAQGLLERNSLPPEDVTFRILEIKPGYAVVAQVCKGPEFFKDVCWKLRSVGGNAHTGPQWIASGDRLVLESLPWTIGHKGFPRTGRLSEGQAPNMAVAERFYSGSDTDEDESTCIDELLSQVDQCSARVEDFVQQGPAEEAAFDIVPAGRPAFRPQIPTLDLSRVTSPQSKPVAIEVSQRAGPGGCQPHVQSCVQMWHCL